MKSITILFTIVFNSQSGRWKSTFFLNLPFSDNNVKSNAWQTFTLRNYEDLLLSENENKTYSLTLKKNKTPKQTPSKIMMSWVENNKNEYRATRLQTAGYQNRIIFYWNHEHIFLQSKNKKNTETKLKTIRVKNVLPIFFRLPNDKNRVRLGFFPR